MTLKILPPVNVTRFEQLKPGQIFVFFDHTSPCYAIKTAKSPNRDRSDMVLLGPGFSTEVPNATLLSWQPATVAVMGRDLTLVLATDPSKWFTDGDRRAPVCLAVCGEDVFVCANGGPTPQRYLACYINLRTGDIVEGRLPSIAAFTRSWRLAAPTGDGSSMTLLEYP